MARHWGLPQKTEDPFHRARRVKPVATFAMTMAFGVFAAAVAILSFAGARALTQSLFHGMSLIPAVIAAGFGCWLYVWIARPRFAAHFAGGDDFSALLRFYGRAALMLAFGYAAGEAALYVKSHLVGVLLFCMSGGAAAAAAFQTVLAFVPAYNPNHEA